MELQELGESIRRSSLCGLGQTAPTRCSPPCKLVPRRVRGPHLRAPLPGRRLQGAGRRALPDRLPGGHRGVALRGARRPRRVRGGLPGHPRRQPVPVGLRPRLQPPVRDRLPLRHHRRRADRHPARSSASWSTASTRRPTSTPSSRPARTPRAWRSSAPGRPASRPRTASRCRATRSRSSRRRRRPAACWSAAIPDYRLPRETLQKEIDVLLNENIELKFDKALGKDFTVDSLQKDGYSASTSPSAPTSSKKLGLPGEDVDGRPARHRVPQGLQPARQGAGQGPRRHHRRRQLRPRCGPRGHPAEERGRP